MSWSRSAKGTPSEVIAAIAGWELDQRDLDKNLLADAAKGHAAQISEAVVIIDTRCRQLDEQEHPVEVTAEAYGHHDGSPGSDTSSVRVAYTTLPISA